MDVVEEEKEEEEKSASPEEEEEVWEVGPIDGAGGEGGLPSEGNRNWFEPIFLLGSG